MELSSRLGTRTVPGLENGLLNFHEYCCEQGGRSRNTSLSRFSTNRFSTFHGQVQFKASRPSNRTHSRQRAGKGSLTFPVGSAIWGNNGEQSTILLPIISSRKHILSPYYVQRTKLGGEKSDSDMIFLP